MRRVLVVCSFVVVLLTLLLVLAPGAGALPPEGAWEWSAPYLPPPATPQLLRFDLTAAGPSGSVYAVGSRYAAEPGPLVVSRVDAAGAELWSVSTLGPGGLGVVAHAVATDADRDLIVAGACNTNQGDVYVVKFRASDGKILWQRRWDSSMLGGDDVANAVAVDKAGNVFVAGSSETASGMTDAIVRKYSPSGRFRWKYTYETSRFDFFFACGADGGGNLYVTGEVDSAPDWAKMLTLKLSPTGAPVWKRTVAGLGVSYGGRFLRVRGTSVTAVGCLWVGATRPVVLRYTLSGKRTWATASSSSVAEVRDMAVDAKGRVVLVGTKMVVPDGGSSATLEAAVVQVYEPGTTWPGREATFYPDFVGAAPYPASFNKVALDSTGAVYCAGTMEVATVASDSRAIVVRYPSVGGSAWTGPEATWTHSAPGIDLDAFYGLVRVNDAEVYACGQQAGAGGTQAILHKISVTAAP